jgi:hypothetical protein
MFLVYFPLTASFWRGVRVSGWLECDLGFDSFRDGLTPPPPSLFSLLSPPNDVTGYTHKIYCCTFHDGYIFAIEGHSY